MPAQRPVTVHPPDGGGRRVRVDGEVLGMASSLRDVTEFLRRAGLEGLDAADIAELELIEWRGGGPHAWPRSV
jgi:hypothetical protein